MFPRLTAFFALLALASCASPYAQNSGHGGFTDKRIDDSRYLVRYTGNGNTSKEQVWSFWFHRCAELTQEHGFRYFAIEMIPPKKQGLLRDQEDGRQLVSRDPREPGGIVRVNRPVIIYVPTQNIPATAWYNDAIVVMCNVVEPRRLVYEAQSVLTVLGPYVKAQVQGPYGKGQAQVDNPDRDLVLKRTSFYLGPEGVVVPANPDRSI